MRFEKETNLYQDAAIANKFSSQDTQFNVVNGKISYLISDSDIEEYEDKSKTVTSRLNSSEDSIGRHSRQISSLQTDIVGINGNIDTFKSEVNTFEQTTNSTISSITSTVATKTQVWTVQPTVPYLANDFWIRDNVLYVCTVSRAIGSFNASDWKPATKGRIFTSEPAPPYYSGDAWMQGDTGEILFCNATRLTGDCNIDDWKKASKYTDDSAFNNWTQNTYNSFIEQLPSQINLQVTGSREIDANTKYTSKASIIATINDQTFESGVRINADRITLDGDATINAINGATGNVVVNANKVNLNAYATFTSLKTAGSTEIDGANIITGSLNASKITGETITAAEIKGSTITGDKIAAETITASNIAAATITGTEIASKTITADNIAVETITADRITTGTITADRIKSSTITGDKIASETITASNIKSGSITANEIKGSTITGSEIAANTITANNIATGTITANRIATGTITADRIKSSTITGDKIASGTITASNIKSSTITSSEIAVGTITSSNIAANTITASEIASGAITADKIKSSTITGDKIASRTITASNIKTGSITANEIKGSTITGNEIASNTITASEIAAGAITAAKIASHTITADEIKSTISLSGSFKSVSSSSVMILEDGTLYVKDTSNSKLGRLQLTKVIASSATVALQTWYTSGLLRLTCGINGSNYIEISDDGIVLAGYSSSSSSKSRIVETEEYDKRALYCYETSSPMFGDLGDGVIAEDGYCYINIDPIFINTIQTDSYQVFLQKYGVGDCYVYEKHSSYFVIAGTPGLAFDWEIKSKQFDCEHKRLDVYSAMPKAPKNNIDYNIDGEDYLNQKQKNITYAEEAQEHIEELYKERTSK